MSVASSTAPSQPRRRFRCSVVAASAVALGAGVLLAPSAQAADRWGPGYSIPDSNGIPSASHIGAYGSPGALFPHTTGHGYCAYPTLAGPEAGGHYDPITQFTTWTSASGRQVSPTDFERAAYVLSRYGDTTNDAQSAAVDADIYTYLNSGTTYALPNGQRAQQRLNYPHVSPEARTKALAFMDEAAKYAGPYTVHIRPQGPIKAGVTTNVELDVTSAAGYKVPGVKLDLSATMGGKSGSMQETTNAEGVAYVHVTMPRNSTLAFTVRAQSLPATTLFAQIPQNAKAQRVLVATGASSAQARTVWTTHTAGGDIKITKTAAGTHKALAGVAFEIKDAAGKVVATGTTNADGVWQAAGLPAGQYTIHEARAVEGYKLTADQTVTVTDGRATSVAVKDTSIPTPNTPRPRLVTITVLPKTGA